MITSKIPALPTSTKKMLAIVAVIVVFLIVGTALTARGEKKEFTIEPSTQSSQRKVRKTNNVLKSIDNDVEFAINPNKIKKNVSKIGNGNNTLIAGAGKKFVTVFVQAKNTGKSRVYLRANSQTLITSEGQRVPISGDLQKLVTNGDWYKSVSPKGHTSGTLVFEIDTNDSVDSIEFRSDRKSEGTKIELN